MEATRKNTIILSSIVVVLLLLGKKVFAAEVPGDGEVAAETQALQVLEEDQAGIYPEGVIVSEDAYLQDKDQPIYLNLSTREVWVPQQISDDIQLVRENGVMVLKRI